MKTDLALRIERDYKARSAIPSSFYNFLLSVCCIITLILQSDGKKGRKMYFFCQFR